MNKCKDGISRPFDNHWHTSKEEYELMARTAFDENRPLSELTRARWFKNGWLKALDEKRQKHRNMGIPDAQFAHPKTRKK